jgi:hypothetical protein
MTEAEHAMCSTALKPKAERTRDPLERVLWYLGRLDFTHEDVELARTTALAIREALKDKLTPEQIELVDRALGTALTLR